MAVCELTLLLADVGMTVFSEGWLRRENRMFYHQRNASGKQ